MASEQFTPGRQIRRRRHTASHVGRTRGKLAAMLVAAFVEIGEECEADPADLRPQQGRWRSDFRMDVCRWEGRVRVLRHGKWDDCPIHSWSRMTDCVRFGVTVCEGDVYGTFEAFAKDDAESFKRRGGPSTDAAILAEANSNYSSVQLEEISLAKARGEAA